VSKLNERRREIRAMNMHDAQQELNDLRRHLFELRIRKDRGVVKNNREFAQVRADIARLMFHLSELQNAAVLEAQGALDDAAVASEEK
jgi:large subunit ribosomal protein L29